MHRRVDQKREVELLEELLWIARMEWVQGLGLRVKSHSRHLAAVDPGVVTGPTSVDHLKGLQNNACANTLVTS